MTRFSVALKFYPYQTLSSPGAFYFSQIQDNTYITNITLFRCGFSTSKADVCYLLIILQWRPSAEALS